MDRKWIWFIVISATVVVLAGIALIVLWQVGILFKQKEHPVQQKNAEPLNVTNDAAEVASTKAIVTIIIEPNEDAVRTTLTKWLQDDENVTVSSELESPNEKNTIQGDILFSSDEWTCVRQRLDSPVQLKTGDYFGYSIDTALTDVVVVGAPGTKNSSGNVFIYTGQPPVSKQTIDAPHSSERFGLHCVLSPQAQTLVVQSERHVYIYRRIESGDYALEFTMSVQPDLQVLSASPENTMWITDQNQGLVHIYDRVGDTWKAVQQAAYLAMDVSYEPETNHVWVASAQGLYHWSRDARGLWVENARWLGDMALTTLDQFAPQKGIHAGINFLAVGEAHNDSMSLVTALNPHAVIDRIQVPGGRSTQQNALFADHVKWWDHAELLIVTVPLDNRNCGSVMVYSLSEDSRLIPLGMLRAQEQESSAQFGSNIKVYMEKRLLISASGGDNTKGKVWIYENH